MCPEHCKPLAEIVCGGGRRGWYVQVFAVNVGAERPVGDGPKDLLTLCQG